MLDLLNCANVLHTYTYVHLIRIIALNGGAAPHTYHQFQRIIESMPSPLPSHETVTRKVVGSAYTPSNDNLDDKYVVPTLLELGKIHYGKVIRTCIVSYIIVVNFLLFEGFVTKNMQSPVWIGGETEALVRLKRHLERKAWVATFEQPKMSSQFLLASQTSLSPYLRFGCLSARLFYHQLTG